MSAKAVLALAAAQVGIKESPAGSNNVIYNTHYYGQAVHDGLWGTKFPWCAVFVWDVFRMAGASALYYGGNKTASCPTLYRFYKQRGQVVPYAQARSGDIVFFTFSAKKNADHVGLVESVQNGVLTTIEGNTSVGNEGNGGMVMRRARKQNVVLAVVRPAYEMLGKEEEDMSEKDVRDLVSQEVTQAVQAISRNIVDAAQELRNELTAKVYDTVEACPAWSQKAVRWAVDSGYIQGDQAGRLNLDDNKVWALQVTYNVMRKREE